MFAITYNGFIATAPLLLEIHGKTTARVTRSYYIASESKSDATYLFEQFVEIPWDGREVGVEVERQILTRDPS